MHILSTCPRTDLPELYCTLRKMLRFHYITVTRLVKVEPVISLWSRLYVIIRRTDSASPVLYIGELIDSSRSIVSISFERPCEQPGHLWGLSKYGMEGFKLTSPPSSIRAGNRNFLMWPLEEAGTVTTSAEGTRVCEAEWVYTLFAVTWFWRRPPGF